MAVSNLPNGFVVTEGRQVEPEYEKVCVQQRSIKHSQVDEDLVGAVLFLSSSESDFTTGQLVNVDGGFRFVGCQKSLAQRVPRSQKRFSQWGGDVSAI